MLILNILNPKWLVLLLNGSKMSTKQMSTTHIPPFITKCLFWLKQSVFQHWVKPLAPYTKSPIAKEQIIRENPDIGWRLLQNWSYFFYFFISSFWQVRHLFDNFKIDLIMSTATCKSKIHQTFIQSTVKGMATSNNYVVVLEVSKVWLVKY